MPDSHFKGKRVFVTISYMGSPCANIMHRPLELLSFDPEALTVSKTHKIDWQLS